MRTKLLLSLLLIPALFSCKKEDITVKQVNSTITTGSWRVTYYWDSNHDATTNFTGYSFVFASAGAVTASSLGTTVNGTWSAGNDDSQVKLILNFASPVNFAKISDDWHVIERTSTKIRLEDVSGGNSDTDYLTFEKL